MNLNSTVSSTRADIDLNEDLIINFLAVASIVDFLSVLTHWRREASDMFHVRLALAVLHVLV